MQLARIRPGDIVRVNKKGRVFLAQVTGKEPHNLELSPITPNITYQNATAREVCEHWKKSR